MLVELDADTRHVVAVERIAGVPDVVFFIAALGRVYVAIGGPGVIEVFDTAPLRRHETGPTEAGARTLAFDAGRTLVCAFLPATHRAAVYADRRLERDHLVGGGHLVREDLRESIDGTKALLT